jgi:hypothetical protein
VERSRLRLALLRVEVEEDLEGRGVGSIVRAVCGYVVEWLFVYLRCIAATGEGYRR